MNISSHAPAGRLANSRAASVSVLLRRLLTTAAILCVSYSLLTPSLAQVPLRFNYQGRIVDGSGPVNDTVALEFSFWDLPTGGSNLYSEVDNVIVVDGLYATVIGDNGSPQALRSALMNPEVYLQVKVGSTVLTPREQLSSVTYAFLAGGVTNDAITAEMVAPEAIEPTHLSSAVSNQFVNQAGDTMSGTLQIGGANDLYVGNVTNRLKFAPLQIIGDGGSASNMPSYIRDSLFSPLLTDSDVNKYGMAVLAGEDASIWRVSMPEGGHSSSDYFVTLDSTGAVDYVWAISTQTPTGGSGGGGIGIGRYTNENVFGAVDGYPFFIGANNIVVLGGGIGHDYGARVEGDLQINSGHWTGHFSDTGGLLSQYEESDTGWYRANDNNWTFKAYGIDLLEMDRTSTGYLRINPDSNATSSFIMNDSSGVQLIRASSAGDFVSIGTNSQVGSSKFGVHGNVQVEGTLGVTSNLEVGATAAITGDLEVSGAYRGNIGPNHGAPFPRPAYDSGWVPVDPGAEVTLTHDVGGNVDDYVVDMQFKSPASGIHAEGVGGDLTGSASMGAYWYDLTASTIGLRRQLEAAGAPEIRIRIWRYN